VRSPQSISIITADDELFSFAESIHVHVLSGPDLMSKSMKEFHPDFREGDAFIHNSPYHGNSHPADVCILVPVFDDLGTHRVTEWVEDTVTSIVTYRCNHKKPLIVTTNLSPDDSGPVAYTAQGGAEVHRKTLTEVIGVRARSRLFEMCRVVRMPAVEDYRMRRVR
jgi:hypothetical protein